MNVDRKYNPELCVSKDETREPIVRLNIVTNHKGIDGPAMVATDGQKLVVVPVELEPDDVPGTLRTDAMKHARRAAPKGKGERTIPLHMRLSNDRVRFADDSDFPRTCKTYNPDRPFPNSSLVVPDAKPGSITVGINANYLHEISKAIGAKSGVVCLTIVPDETPDVSGMVTTTRPIIVRESINRSDLPAFAVLMPARF